MSELTQPSTALPKRLPSEWRDQGCTIRVLKRIGNTVLAERIRASGNRDSYEVFLVELRPPFPGMAPDGTFMAMAADAALVEAYPRPSFWGRYGISISDHGVAIKAFELSVRGESLGSISINRLHYLPSHE